MDNGFSPFLHGIPHRTNFFENTEKVFGVAKPTFQGFINFLFDRLKSGEKLVTFDVFFRYMSRWSPKLFEARWRETEVRAFLLRADFDLWKQCRGMTTMRELFRVIWNTQKGDIDITNHALFDDVQKDGKRLVDDEGNLVFYFDGEIRQQKEAIEL
jgi:hypothetical protein